MSKNVLRETYEELKEAGYYPYRKQRETDKQNRRITRENRKAHFETAPACLTGQQTRKKIRAALRAQAELARKIRQEALKTQAEQERKKQEALRAQAELERKRQEAQKAQAELERKQILNALKTQANLTLEQFLNALKTQANLTRTENGAMTLVSSGSDVLDLFACVGAIRHLDDWEIFSRFFRAWAEDRDLALRILFYARDVRGGLGERRVFRSILSWLALLEPESIRKNIALIPFYGRYDDLLELLDTPCGADVLNFIRTELAKDTAALAAGKDVSLLAKWLPSVNASSEETRRKAVAIARGIGMSDSQYRRTLSNLRSAERILENRLRERDYSFSYSAQPSRAMFKYRQAFLRNDKKRYKRFLRNVETGRSTLHTAGVVPYELVRRVRDWNLDTQERHVLDVTWNALEDYTNGRSALAVVDVSGSMTCQCMGTDGPLPIDVAVSLGLYFAERNKGAFRNHFITFSDDPCLIEVKGEDLADKVRYIMSAPWGMSTNIQAVFELILKTAVENDLPQSELPETLYIISDMEFNYCTRNADLTNFEYAKKLFEDHGYRLPSLVFWNVQSRNQQSPVKMNEQGAALISGASPRIFSLVAKGELDLLDPYKFMMSVIGSERYAGIHA